MINIEAELCKSVTVYRFASLLLLTSSSIFRRNVGALRLVVTEPILERSLCTVSCVNKHNEYISQFEVLGTTFTKAKKVLQPFKYEAQTALLKDPVRTAQ